MSDPRYVISQELPCGGGEFCSHDYRPCPVALEPVLDLPDAEHIHVTRHPDGTITATPMAEQTFPQPTYTRNRTDGVWGAQIDGSGSGGAA
jgi:hypothetical protein